MNDNNIYLLLLTTCMVIVISINSCDAYCDIYMNYLWLYLSGVPYTWHNKNRKKNWAICYMRNSAKMLFCVLWRSTLPSAQFLPSVVVKALGKGAGFAECFYHDTRQRGKLCQVVLPWHSAKGQDLPIALPSWHSTKPCHRQLAVFISLFLSRAFSALGKSIAECPTESTRQTALCRHHGCCVTYAEGGTWQTFAQCLQTTAKCIFVSINYCRSLKIYTSIYPTSTSFQCPGSIYHMIEKLNQLIGIYFMVILSSSPICMYNCIFIEYRCSREGASYHGDVYTHEL